MFGTATAAITSLKTALDMLKVAVDSRDFIKLAEVKITLTDRILDVQTAFLELQEKSASLLQEKHTLANEKRELETQLVHLQEQIDKLARYERIQTPVGAIVFIDRYTKDVPDGSVYACAACMDDGKVTTLQPINQGTQLHCHIHGAFGFATEPQRGPVGMLIPKRLLKP